MMSESPPQRLILASSSQYRKMLLQRLSLTFSCESPELDETPGANEAPADYVARLAHEKADKIAQSAVDAIVIGSDQTALFNDQVVGKPGDFKQAFRQLTAFSGRQIEFLTSVSVLRADTGFAEHYTDKTVVSFRDLQADEIERYLNKEQPYDCAGSFKAESLGVVLFSSISSIDPSAIIGLPLIETAAMLRRAGLLLP